MFGRKQQDALAGRRSAVRRAYLRAVRALDPEAYAALVDYLRCGALHGYCRSYFYDAGPKPRDLILWIEPAKYANGCRFYPREWVALYRAAVARGLAPIRESVREWLSLWERTPEGRWGYGH